MLLPFDYKKDPYLILDFSASNPDLETLDLTDTALFSAYVYGKLRAAGARVGMGGYNEHRVIYRRSKHFNTSDETSPYNGPREIHLGIDFWAEAGTPVFALLAGRVHSFQDNAHFGDYGPTIILEHTGNAAGKSFGQTAFQPRYSLYGHLTRQSLDGLQEGMEFNAGQKIGEIGPYPENGDWPPHLHFQLMTDMLGLKGDFPGVCSLADREKFLRICPNPNDLLGIAGLG
ncbi:peptidoglycan DD-metalloendopeptidase family protein [Spirosoma sp. KCTC 42546]|uniref:peptidoglycan DD-metalloendopeptidase family protein n=1 Tax=Spirosoma sp. KCTC 42546 TaxID=2520506 RepID=UPI00115A1B75|nr:peptidoglycan DD-metalloendopeptidase family protein [Spirosoma sp. KCTC 42546]QDK81657.1 peptidoglycan DD-metalloendopeptidase family protein [Spirosoma sp. KCTC 42546]